MGVLGVLQPYTKRVNPNVSKSINKTTGNSTNQKTEKLQEPPILPRNHPQERCLILFTTSVTHFPTKNHIISFPQNGPHCYHPYHTGNLVRVAAFENAAEEPKII